MDPEGKKDEEDYRNGNTGRESSSASGTGESDDGRKQENKDDETEKKELQKESIMLVKEDVELGNAARVGAFRAIGRTNQRKKAAGGNSGKCSKNTIGNKPRCMGNSPWYLLLRFLFFAGTDDGGSAGASTLVGAVPSRSSVGSNSGQQVALCGLSENSPARQGMVAMASRNEQAAPVFTASLGESLPLPGVTSVTRNSTGQKALRGLAKNAPQMDESSTVNLSASITSSTDHGLSESSTARDTVPSARSGRVGATSMVTFRGLRKNYNPANQGGAEEEEGQDTESAGVDGDEDNNPASYAAAASGDDDDDDDDATPVVEDDGSSTPSLNNEANSIQGTVPVPAPARIAPGVSDANLAVANPVPQEESNRNLQVAEQYNPAGDLIAKERAAKRKAFQFLLLGVLVLVGVVLLVVFVGMGGNSGSGMDSNATMSLTLSPTTAPTESLRTRMEDRLTTVLPTSTLEAIFPTISDATDAEVLSPQAEAFSWLLEDENLVSLETYTDERILQRYALAVFYFALRGDEWLQRDNWTNHDSHECDWFNLKGELGSTYEDYQKIRTPCEQGESGEDLVIRHLWLDSNNLNGTLPRELFTMLTSLKTLSLAFNLYDDQHTVLYDETDESEVAALFVRDMYPRTTGFSGTIPTEIALLTELEALALYANGLSGNIPTEVGQLSSMR